jgi:hypothetical protein
MAKFPVDAPVREVVKALELLGFRVVRDISRSSPALSWVMGTSPSALAIQQQWCKSTSRTTIPRPARPG